MPNLCSAVIFAPVKIRHICGQNPGEFMKGSIAFGRFSWHLIDGRFNMQVARITTRLSSCSLLLLGLAAPGAADSLWEHNGSILQLREEGTVRSFRYSQPRAELKKAGVGDGTVLFQGKQVGNRVSGTAYRFSKGCGAVGYEVEGAASPNAQGLTLSGRAPKRNSKCEVVNHFTDVLVFRRREAVEQQPVAATIDKKIAAAAKPKKQQREPGKAEISVQPNIPPPNKAQATLAYPVMGCKSRDTFDQWVEMFRRADAASEAKVVAQGMRTKDCAALKDGPVDVQQADDSYLCVRPIGKADCYWTLRASVR
jgi:hypothetical protein